jgi:tryptophan halogenase
MIADTLSTGPRARLLWQLVAGLGVDFGYERSFQVCRGALLPNRFLLSLARRAIGTKPDERILDLCRRLGMPREFLEAVQGELEAARFVHFGFEESRTTNLYKVYLERDIPAGAPAGLDPILLHVAFKWDIGHADRGVRTRYHWHPGLTAADLLRRVSAVYASSAHGDSLDIARGVIQLAAGRMAYEDMRYLELAEEDNARRSFVLSVYDAGLRVADLYPYLARMCRRHAIPAEQFQGLYERIGARAFGHLAGGLHRDGQDFFTVYFGVEGGRG